MEKKRKGVVWSMNLEQAFKKVDAAIDEGEVKDLLMDLISIESHKESETDELEICRYIESYFRAEEIESELDFVTDSRPNIYARIGKGAEGKNFMLNGHTDTVPTYNMKNAFEPRLEDGIIHGRGAVDMKGAIAAMMIALAAVKRADISLQGQFIFTGVIDEEQRCIGAKKISDQLYPLADYAIVGEPTNMEVMIGHKGMEWIEITVYGRSSHGSTPEKGINAIRQAAKLIRKIEEELIEDLPNRADPLLGEPTLNIGVIQGGVDPNVIPDICKINFDRRWVPGESTESMKQEFEKIIQDLQAEDATFKADVRRMSEVTGIHVPLSTPRDHEFVHLLENGMEELFNENAEVGVFKGWSDAAQLSTAGITSVVCGPGDIQYAHANDEQVPVSEVMKAARYYAYMALKICM